MVTNMKKTRQVRDAAAAHCTLHCFGFKVYSSELIVVQLSATSFYFIYLNILQYTVQKKFAYTQKHNMRDILQVIKGCYSATTYITPKNKK